MDKAALRRDLGARRAAFVAGLPSAGRDGLQMDLARLLDARLPRDAVIASYVAFGPEIDPAPFARLRPDARIAHPWFAGRDSPMRFRVGAGRETGPWTIDQPADGPFVDPSVVLAPLVAADRRGHRLGRGAGHYDRALAALRANGPLTVVGLAWSIQIVETLPADPWDIPLDAIATPGGWFDIPRPAA